MDYEPEEVNIYKIVDLIKLEVYCSILELKGNLSHKKVKEAIDEGITNACDRAYGVRDDIFT